MKNKIEAQKKIVQAVEENITQAIEDMKFFKADVKNYEKIKTIAGNLPDEQEKELLGTIAIFTAETEENITHTENTLVGLKAELKEEKTKLTKLERLEKEFDLLTVEEEKEVEKAEQELNQS